MTTYTPRPHREYLEWIDNRLEILKEPLTALEVIAFSGITNVIRASLLANRDTLERHYVPIEQIGAKRACPQCYFTFLPCPTYTDITQRLDEVMG